MSYIRKITATTATTSTTSTTSTTAIYALKVLDGCRTEVGSADGICAQAYARLTGETPLITAFMQQIESRPNIKAWRESPHHCKPTQTGPGF